MLVSSDNRSSRASRPLGLLLETEHRLMFFRLPHSGRITWEIFADALKCHYANGYREVSLAFKDDFDLHSIGF